MEMEITIHEITTLKHQTKSNLPSPSVLKHCPYSLSATFIFHRHQVSSFLCLFRFLSSYMFCSHCCLKHTYIHTRTHLISFGTFTATCLKLHLGCFYFCTYDMKCAMGLLRNEYDSSHS